MLYFGTNVIAKKVIKQHGLGLFWEEQYVMIQPGIKAWLHTVNAVTEMSTDRRRRTIRKLVMCS